MTWLVSEQAGGGGWIVGFPGSQARRIKKEYVVAWMIPPTIPPDATPGERQVFSALEALPEAYTVCYRRLFAGPRHVQEPDFVVLGADIGLIVLEVKDWRGPQPDKGLERKDPLAQAKAYVHGLQDLVRKRGFPVLVDLEGRHAGELVFPCVPAVALPYVKSDRLEGLGLSLDPRHVLVREDLAAEVVGERLRQLARQYFPPRLTGAQVEFLRGLVVPEILLEAPNAAEPPRQLDLFQTHIVSSDLFLPPPEEQLARDLSARLVRGVAGSGKTLLLLVRAKLLQQLRPAWRFLVLTYNRDLARFLRQWFVRLEGDPATVEITNIHKWCRDRLVEAEDWQEILGESERTTLVARAIQEAGEEGRLPPERVARELEWIRDYVEPPCGEHYLTASRTGMGERLDRGRRQAVLKILERYQGLLRTAGKRDWTEVPLRVNELVAQGKLPAPRYHAILVDETQDFAPSWFRVLLRMLKPETNLLFLVGDGAQRVYRPDLSWTRLGISLKGRSRVLRRVYRNTAEIAQYAMASVRSLAPVAEELAEYGEDWIEAELDHPWARHGAEPTLRGFATPEAEWAFLVEEVRALLARGRSPADILVLQARREAARHLAGALQKAGIPAVPIKEGGLTFEPPAVNVCTFHSAKGLEFPIVFCSMTHLFPESRRADQPADSRSLETEAARLLYVGMTRARDVLYVTYQIR
jgi:hypothetical protein